MAHKLATAFRGLDNISIDSIDEARRTEDAANKFMAAGNVERVVAAVAEQMI